MGLIYLLDVERVKLREGVTLGEASGEALGEGSSPEAMFEISQQFKHRIRSSEK